MADKTDVGNMSVSGFLESAGAKEPTPGGGAAAAVAGALGASMALMAARYTTGKKYAAVAEQVKDTIRQLEASVERFIALAGEDMAAYSGVNSAYGLPKKTAKEKKAREEAVRSACREAARPPSETLALSAETLNVVAALSEIVNPMLKSDVGVAAHILVAAASSAFINVKVNAEIIGESDGDELLSDSRGMLRSCREKAAKTLTGMI